jgi:hypothetical protein
VSSDCDLDDLCYQRSEGTINSKSGRGGQRSHLALPGIMHRHLNCIKTVQMFRLSGGTFSLQSWLQRRLGQLRFSYQLNSGCRDYPRPDAVVKAVNCHTSCHSIGHGGISDTLAQPEIAPGDDDCRSYGSVDEVDRSQTFCRNTLIYWCTGGGSSEDSISNSEAVEVYGEQEVRYQQDQYPDWSWCHSGQYQQGQYQQNNELV